MGILKRFKDLMAANINTVLEKAEAKNADKLLEQYLREAKSNLDQVKAETAGIIADETAAGRKVVAIDEEIAKLDRYAEQAVLAGNDEDAKKFLEGKATAVARKADAEKAFEQAKVNSDRMRQLTQKLNSDIVEAQSKLGDLKAKLDVAKQTEKMAELSEKISSVGYAASDYDRLAEAVQKRIDAVDAKAELNKELDETADIEALKEKYEVSAESETAGVSIDNELAALKARLGQQ